MYCILYPVIFTPQSTTSLIFSMFDVADCSSYVDDEKCGCNVIQASEKTSPIQQVALLFQGYFNTPKD